MNSDQGIKAGLEIHQQLETSKLFCPCASVLSETVTGSVERRLHLASSELGEVDEAARMQAMKAQLFEYEITGNSCLVELDEEPPHEANAYAIETALIMCELLHSRVVDEIHFMRKIVVDGSNTGGFQRTALVGTGGWVEVGGRRIGIQSVCCEEDACRRIEGRGEKVIYRLDRLGIPLLEISTAPDIDSPQLLKETARKIGMLLRSTGRVKRGIGTIREDLNISVEGGARVEIKGVQELEMLPRIAAGEAERQRRLIDAAAVLKSRNASVKPGFHDMTELFAATDSVLGRASGRGERVAGMLLHGFSGQLASGGISVIGTEIAQRLRQSGISGIIHSDELPGYGIDEGMVRRIADLLGAGRDDAFVLCAVRPDMVHTACSIIRERAVQALEGVPEETRDAHPDGSTAYSRPLPGSARMYPETDVLPIAVDRRMMEEVSRLLPESFESIASRIEAHGVHRQQALQIAEGGDGPLFLDLALKYGNAQVLARILLNIIPEVERAEGIKFERFDFIAPILRALSEGRFAKEAIDGILRCVAQGKSAEQCIEAASEAVGLGEAEKLIVEIAEKHRELIVERGERALSPLMGIAMKELRGRVDGGHVSALLVKHIRRMMKEGQ